MVFGSSATLDAYFDIGLFFLEDSMGIFYVHGHVTFLKLFLAFAGQYSYHMSEAM